MPFLLEGVIVKCRNCGQDNPEGARFCSACGAPLVVPWRPGVGSSYQNAWRQLWKNFLALFLILIISFFISSLPSAGDEFAVDTNGVSIFTIFTLTYGILIQGPIGFGTSFAYLKAARGDKVQIKDMFEAFRNYWNAVLASLLVGAIILVGMVPLIILVIILGIIFAYELAFTRHPIIFVVMFPLIIPGIIFACKLAFTPYLVVDRKMGAVEAVKESWRMTGGHAWKVFFIGLLAIPISIVGLLCLGVGIIVAIMWVALASASLYHAVSRLKEASPPQTAPVS